MTKKLDTTKTVAIFVGALLLILTVIVMASTGKSPRPLAVAFVEDSSRSTPGGHGCLESTVTAAVKGAPDEVLFIYMQTGNESSAWEPIETIPPLRIRKSEIPWGSGPNAVKKVLDAYLSTIPNTPLERSDASPLVVSVERAIESIKSHAQSDRIVIIACDLEDTTVPAMIQAFKEPLGTKSKNLPKLDNSGVAVHFVAIESTVGEERTSSKKLTGARTPARIKRLQEVWKACFVEPELISFTATCNDPMP